MGDMGSSNEIISAGCAPSQAVMINMTNKINIESLFMFIFISFP
jgi:hypothetical protein